MKTKIGLVLGAGGLRGLAHVGVLKVLEQEGITVDLIVGCSIGSMIGALYAAGLDPETIWKLAKHLKRRHWLDFSVPKMGLITGERAYQMLKLLTKQKRIEDLKIPFAVVATDLKTGREVVFTEGEVARAVRASISVPGIFVPYEIDGVLLVDGAVINPTPIDVARRMGADIVIAVDLAHAGTVYSITNMFDVIIQSIDIMERELCSYRQHQCDVLVRPDVAHISPSSFEHTDECIALGEAAMGAALPALRQIITERVEQRR